MRKDKIIKLYIGDLKAHVNESDARDNRISTLNDELNVIDGKYINTTTQADIRNKLNSIDNLLEMLTDDTVNIHDIRNEITKCKAVIAHLCNYNEQNK